MNIRQSRRLESHAFATCVGAAVHVSSGYECHNIVHFLQLYDAGIKNLDALEPSAAMLQIAQQRGIYQRIMHVRA